MNIDEAGDVSPDNEYAITLEAETAIANVVGGQQLAVNKVFIAKDQTNAVAGPRNAKM